MHRSQLRYQIIIALVILVGGAALTFGLALPMYRQAQSSESWPTAEGKIESSQVKSDFDPNQNRTTYIPFVEFSYEVAGKSFRSNYIWPSGGTSSSSETMPQEIVGRYPLGSPVKVHYDPENHEFGVLEPGVSGTNYALLGFGLVLVVAGLILGIHAGYGLSVSAGT